MSRTPFGMPERSPYPFWDRARLERESRSQLVAWLTWNDPNGEYTSADVWPEEHPDWGGEPAPTTEEYRAAALQQYDDGQPAGKA